jgi:hypothetical protein
MKLYITLLATLVAAFATPAAAQESPFFKKLIGNWTFESEALVAPGQPKVKAKGTEQVRALGSFWVVLESKLAIAGSPMENVMTIGVGGSGKALEGTFISSMMGTMVVYKGSLSKDGKTLELMTEMPDPSKGGKKTKMKDVISLQSDNQRTLKSFALDDGGKWVEFLSAKYTRAKS